MSEKTVWPALQYDDAKSAIRLISDVFGFRETLTVPDDDGDIVHAELRGPDGGGVMLGSTKHCKLTPGPAGLYVVTDDVDAVYDRARAASLEITEDLHDTDYGSHTFTARDPEGNLWTFGTYRGAA